MAETAVQKDTSCRKCGADIRPDSLFCYNCGSDLAIPRSNGALPDPTHVVDGKKRPGSEPLELRTAASIKRTRPDRSRRQFEIVWEGAEDGPPVLFVVATAVIVLITAVIVFLAFYLR